MERVLGEYSCTLLASGQSETGKTHTIESGYTSDTSYDGSTTGIIPRAVDHIFEELEKTDTEEYSVRVLYLELYSEEWYDLLALTLDNRKPTNRKRIW